MAAAAAATGYVHHVNKDECSEDWWSLVPVNLEFMELSTCVLDAKWSLYVWQSACPFDSRNIHDFYLIFPVKYCFEFIIF